jgi:HEAT repeat protein
VDVERLIQELRADDWQVAARAAVALREASGQQVTDALVAALDAHDTAITDAAAESLILRNEPGTAERMWQALSTLAEDVTDHIWDAVERLRAEPISRELERRFDAQA